MNGEDEALLHAKMRSGDYTGARKMILETLKTTPALDAASAMLSVCEILCTSQMELPGSGTDWYWILKLYSAASHSDIEAQYRKIVAQLNLVMHSFPGTDLALSLAADAYSVLSDPVRRAEFDSKRNLLHNNSNGNNCSRLIQDDDDDDDVEEIYVSTAHPVKEWFYDFGKDRRVVESFSNGQIWATYDRDRMPRIYCEIGEFVPQMHMFRVTWAGRGSSCGEFVLDREKVTLCEPPRFSHLVSGCVAGDAFEVYPKEGEVWAIYRDWDVEWCSKPKLGEECGFEMVEILTDCSKYFGAMVAYLSRVEGFKNNIFRRYLTRGSELSFRIPADKILMFSHKVPAYRFVGGEMSGITKGMLELDKLAVPHNLVESLSSTVIALSLAGSQTVEEMQPSISRPPPILHNEESSSETRTGKSRFTLEDFAVDQIWAVYYGPDHMPRNYAKVIRMMSPTKVCVSFLEPHPMLDQEIRWTEEKLPMACGVFQARKTTTILDITKFSHVVNCDRSLKKLFYRVFPKKGEIWAVYKNWKNTWKISDFDGYQCQMVEILSDFSEEHGVSVCCLVEVKGYLTFFQRLTHDGFELSKRVSRSELLSFSHQVPAFTVINIRNHDIPEGSLHLEPDAIPRSS